eukprot:g246.t1
MLPRELITVQHDEVSGYCGTLAYLQQSFRSLAHADLTTYGQQREDRIFNCEDFEEKPIQWVSLGFAGALVAATASLFFFRYVMSQPVGDPEKDKLLIKTAEYVHVGAKTFLHTEYAWLCLFVFGLCVTMALLFGFMHRTDDLAPLFVVICILAGATLSALAGYIGMFIATKANIRTTNACREGLGQGLSVSFKSGAVMGLTVTGLALFGLSIFVVAYDQLQSEWNYIAGFGFGASSIALFARVGGGVYTKAADVGADLVGKVENNIPEDDARNPAVIADNVGDNVGDVAGMGADLFESYAGSIIAACTIAHHAVTQSNDVTSLLIMAVFAYGRRSVTRSDTAASKTYYESNSGLFEGTGGAPNYAHPVLSYKGTPYLSENANSAMAGNGEVATATPVSNYFPYSASQVSKGFAQCPEARALSNEYMKGSFNVALENVAAVKDYCLALCANAADCTGQETATCSADYMCRTATANAKSTCVPDDQTWTAAHNTLFKRLVAVEDDKQFRLYEKLECDLNTWGNSQKSCEWIANLPLGTTSNPEYTIAERNSLYSKVFATAQACLARMTEGHDIHNFNEYTNFPLTKKIPFVNSDQLWSLMALPFFLAGLGICCSIIGIFTVRTSSNESEKKNLTKEQREKEDMELLEKLLWITRIGIFVAGFFVVAGSALVCWLLFDNTGFAWRCFFSVVIGLVTGICIGNFTEYVTSYTYMPTMSIAQMSETGPATVIIQGMGVGMISTVVPSLLIVIAILSTYELAGVYGISIAAVGMLSTLGVTLATDAYGPVADNAGGLAEMCLGDDEEHVRDRTDALDALGNTTAATGKGFAIGSAVLTAVGLISAYMEEVRLNTGDVDLSNPYVMVGVLIGAMLPFLFGALTMLSVGRSAEAIILQVRMQFYKVNMAIATGDLNGCDSWDNFKPDEHFSEKEAEAYYNDCIAIATTSALQEMLIPGILAIFAPAVVGFLLGAPALAGLLIGALTSGFMLALTMSNAGGAWDNAKKFCEKGGLGAGKGKGTANHAATVVGDTVGDPFKDTSGPSLNILIKLMSIVALVLAPLFKTCCQEEFGKEGVISGLVLLVATIVMCILIQKWMEKSNAARKAEVDAKMNDINNMVKKSHGKAAVEPVDTRPAMNTK